MASGYYAHRGGTANTMCMHASNPQYPDGYSDSNQHGNMLYGTEYKATGGPFDKNVNGDAACVMCSRGGFALSVRSFLAVASRSRSRKHGVLAPSGSSSLSSGNLRRKGGGASLPRAA